MGPALGALGGLGGLAGRCSPAGSRTPGREPAGLTSSVARWRAGVVWRWKEGGSTLSVQRRDLITRSILALHPPSGEKKSEKFRYANVSGKCVPFLFPIRFGRTEISSAWSCYFWKQRDGTHTVGGTFPEIRENFSLRRLLPRVDLLSAGKPRPAPTPFVWSLESVVTPRLARLWACLAPPRDHGAARGGAGRRESPQSSKGGGELELTLTRDGMRDYPSSPRPPARPSDCGAA